MKTIATASLIALLALSSVACDVQPDTQETSSAAISAALIGTWSSSTMTLSLLKNGAYVFVPPAGDGFTNGTWNVNGTTLDLGGNSGAFTMSGDTLSVAFVAGYGTVTFSRTQKF